MEKEKKDFFGLTVKVVIVNQENKVLVVKRSKNDSIKPGRYDLPGGRIEAGENIDEAVNREIKEELGIEVEIGPIVYAFDFGKKYDRKYDLGDEKILVGGKGFRFLAYYKEGEIKLSDEHEEFQWLDFEKALEKFDESDFEKDKVEAIKKAKEYLEMQKSMEGWKRERADFENYKKRQIENQKDMVAFSNLNLISEILPILDNFHVSTDHIPEDQKENSWVVGIMHIQKQMEKVLEDYGVSEIKVMVGDKFDPSLMEAIADANLRIECAMPAGSQESTNKSTVKKIMQKGYKINSKVIRAAKVIVE